MSTFRSDFLAHGVTSIGEMAETARSVEALDAAVADGSLDGRIALYAMAPSLLPVAAACEGSRFLLTQRAREGLGPGSEGVRRRGILRTECGQPQRLLPRPQPPSGIQGQTQSLPRRPDGSHQDCTPQRRADRHPYQRHQGAARSDRCVSAVGDAHGHPSVRIEHLGDVLDSVEEIASWRAANVIPVMQPGFLHNFIGDYLPMLFPATGSTGRLPLRTVLHEGVSPVISSDITLGGEPGATNPLHTIWSAVSRRS